MTLHLKPEDTDDHLYDYTSQWKLEEIVKKYSDFIAWPIRMEVSRTTKGEDGADEVTFETKTLNSQKALWARSRDEVSDDEYHEFYKHVATRGTNRSRSSDACRGNIRIPSVAVHSDARPVRSVRPRAQDGIQLYVKRVFIMDDCEDLIPEYLRFVKGVVDAQDLSLNVSREILQQDRQIRAIRRRLTKKVLSTVKDMATHDADKYRTFWNEFGRVLKEGLISDTDNRDTLLAITSFDSTASATSRPRSPDMSSE